MFFISGIANYPVYRSALACPEELLKRRWRTEVSVFLQLAALVPTGRHAFKYRRWFVPLVPLAPELRVSVRQWPERLGNRSIEEEHRVQVLVRDNNVDQALRVLKKKMQREGVFREMKLRARYEKPSERRVREKAEARRRARKLARKKLQREGLLPMKPRVAPAVPGRGGPARTPRF